MINFVDCTFRDGGYYNNWDFPQKIIQEYLNIMPSIGVNTVELGFRFPNREGFKGPCAFSDDDFLNQLYTPKELKIAVMINASDILKNEDIDRCLETLFPNRKSNSPVDIVRIATHYNELNEALKLTTWLKDNGYLVGLNIMQISDRTNKDLKLISEKANLYPIEVLYFADSTGSLKEKKLKKIISIFKSNFKKNIGIHAHDNLGLSLSHSLTALNSGVCWVDSTITGMGRGAGNVCTEYLSFEISKLRNVSCDLTQLSSLIDDYFIPLKNKHMWGTNLYYYLAGEKSIHPTFVQEMIEDKRYSGIEIIPVIDRLASKGAKKFSKKNLENARNYFNFSPKGKYNPINLLKDREVLLIGPGESVKKHLIGIENYILKNKPVTLAINKQEFLNFKLIEANIVCHPVRLMADLNFYLRTKANLIMPEMLDINEALLVLKKKKIFNYGLTVKTDKFYFGKSECIIPVLLSAAFGIAFCNSGKAKKISMVGFDGYDVDDPRFNEMNEFLDFYSSHNDIVQLLSLTPTKFNIFTKSIYGNN